MGPCSPLRGCRVCCPAQGRCVDGEAFQDYRSSELSGATLMAGDLSHLRPFWGLCHTHPILGLQHLTRGPWVPTKGPLTFVPGTSRVTVGPTSL